MRILIIEDEIAALRQMQALVSRTTPGAQLAGSLDSVKGTLEWMAGNAAPDLIISDIQLADGTCFEIFRELNLNIPIIFTTAYDEYVLKAFKLNSIDYLLKPIDEAEFRQAIEKYQFLARYTNVVNRTILDNFRQSGYKSKFLVRQGQRYLVVLVEDVAFLRADGSVVFLHTVSGSRHIVDHTLEELENLLDPAQFFRLNRKYIVPVVSIIEILPHLNGKLKVRLAGSEDAEIYVSREKAMAFKQWLDK